MTMNRESYLRVFGVDPAKWARRYGLEPFTVGCKECGLAMSTTIPVARGKLRGLLAPVCECGNADTPYCVVGLFPDGG